MLVIRPSISIFSYCPWPAKNGEEEGGIGVDESLNSSRATGLAAHSHASSTSKLIPTRDVEARVPDTLHISHRPVKGC